MDFTTAEQLVTTISTYWWQQWQRASRMWDGPSRYVVIATNTATNQQYTFHSPREFDDVAHARRRAERGR